MATEKHRANETQSRWRSLAESLVLPGAIFFLELAFKLSTAGGLVAALPFIVLFSLCFGLALEVPCSLPHTIRTRFAARAVVLLVLGVLFGVEYFVYRQFKLYYDPVTVLSGAGDAAGQFSDEALGLVLSPTGLLNVALALLPAVACGAYALRCKDAPLRRIPRTTSAIQAGGALAAHALAVALVFSGPFANTYTTRYCFQNAVTSFGFLTGLRKDAQAQWSGGGTSFEQESAGATKSVTPVKATQAKKAKKTYKPNVLDIDFDALAASPDNETWANLDRYVDSLTPSMRNKYTGMFKDYNLIFISAEAFSAEAMREDTTPTLWRMWNEGIQLTDYYQFDTAGTTGGECANLFGLLATEGGSSVKGTASYNNYLTLGNLLNRRGYDGWAFHNNTYTYYGRDTTHNNLGYNNGYIGYGNGMEQWVTWQWPQSDLEMVQGTFDNLYGSLGDEEHPFNVYYMSVSGHSNYDPSDNMMSQKNWEAVKDLPYSDRVKGYLACNIELDRAMEYLIGQLEERGIADRTVIVISADHFPYGLDDDAPVGQLPYLSELYGYDVTNIFQRDHNRPLIWSGSLANRKKPIVVDTPTMSIDLLPTLCNLFGLKWDSRLLPGRDVLDRKTEPIAFNLNYDWRTELGTYWAGTGTFEPVEGAEVPEGYVEAHNSLVANKINYCHGVLTSDYYRHVFGEPDDVQDVHDKAQAKRAKRASKASE